MATLDWSRCPIIESVPDRIGGAWVFKGTRLPVATVIENLEDLSVDEVIDQFDVTREQVTAVLEFVAQSLHAAAVPAGARSLTTARPSPPDGQHQVVPCSAHAERIAAAVASATPGRYAEVEIPFEPK